MPPYTKTPPDILDPQEASVRLTKFVWPMVTDQAIIGTPVPGNRITASVSIQIKGDRITLTTDQYEKLRIGVLIPIAEQYRFSSFLSSGVPIQQIEAHARLLIEKVFEND